MAIPDFQTLMLPLLELAGDGREHTSAEAVESLAQRFQLSSVEGLGRFVEFVYRAVTDVAAAK